MPSTPTCGYIHQETTRKLKNYTFKRHINGETQRTARGLWKGIGSPGGFFKRRRCSSIPPVKSTTPSMARPWPGLWAAVVAAVAVSAAAFDGFQTSTDPLSHMDADAATPGPVLSTDPMVYVLGFLFCFLGILRRSGLSLTDCRRLCVCVRRRAPVCTDVPGSTSDRRLILKTSPCRGWCVHVAVSPFPHSCHH